MITSKQNALIKEIRSLADKKYRDKLGLFVVEGIKPINEAIELKLPIRAIICTEKAFPQINGEGQRVELVADEVLKSVSEEVSPQGALAVVIKPEVELRAPTGNCLLLDGVADPSNIGAIIRTAVASNFKQVYMTKESADPYAQKAVRASMSGIFRVEIMRGEVSEILKVINLPIYVGDMDGENVFQHKVKSAVCLVIGNEGHGVSEKVKRMANVTVKIPMENGMESLNAAVSAGILMYALKESAEKSF